MRREREGKEENDEAGAQAEAGADAPSHFSSRYTSILRRLSWVNWGPYLTFDSQIEQII